MNGDSETVYISTSKWYVLFSIFTEQWLTLIPACGSIRNFAIQFYWKCYLYIS